MNTIICSKDKLSCWRAGEILSSKLTNRTCVSTGISCEKSE